jgi:hypothetical protein
MSNDGLLYDSRAIHGADSNSLLRMYDLANQLLSQSKLQQERARADRAVRRIAKELQKRKITL